MHTTRIRLRPKVPRSRHPAKAQKLTGQIESFDLAGTVVPTWTNWKKYNKHLDSL